MKLALSLTDQSFIATKSVGIFNVSMGLARGLMDCREVEELHILGNEECAGAFHGCPGHVHLHLAGKAVPRRFARVWWDQWGVSSAIRRIAPDWVLLPKGFPPYFPRLGGARLACYVHDVNWEYYETRRGGGRENPFPRHQLAYFRRLGLRALAVSDLVLTSTQFNLARFAAHVPGVRAAAVGIGFDSPLREPAATPGADVLFYASPYPHKLTRLGIARLEAWLAARGGRGPAPRIHVIGRLPGGCALPGGQWVEHGRLPQAELDSLMRGQCRVSVYFSDYEGFGMPPVESLRAGLPCVASDLPPIRENIPARYLFDNADEQSFIRTMDAAYGNPGAIERPAYPDWREVARRAVAAMLGRR